MSHTSHTCRPGGAHRWGRLGEANETGRIDMSVHKSFGQRAYILDEVNFVQGIHHLN